MRELALFAGAGGGILGGQLVGFHTTCAVEIDPCRIKVLLQRQADGCLPRFPIWDDIRTFDGRPFRGHVDIITGGFPCTDISCAGKGAGITGKNSRLFFEMLRIIGEVRPRFILSENAKELRTKGLGVVLTGLAHLGYDARWGVLGARHVGANHHRKRMWVVAADTNGETVRVQPGRGQREKRQKKTFARITDWWDIPRFTGVDDGDTDRMDRVRATGDMQVPAVVALAWEILSQGWTGDTE